VRVNNVKLAKSSLAEAKSIEITEDESSTIADELAHVKELVSKA
jgi:hypothetical protein